MNKLTQTNLRSKLPLKNPPKTPRAGDVGWMVDCEIVELTKFTNLGQNPPNIPTPGVLWAYGREKVFSRKSKGILKEMREL